MGIKPTYIKTIGEELLTKFGDRFGNNFSENKAAVGELARIGSKRVRNRIAGYVTRRLNSKRKT